MNPAPILPPAAVAVYGLGIIGSRAAANLATAGYDIRVWSRTPKPDAPGWRDGIAEAAAGARLHQIFVRDGAAVEAVLDGLLPHLDAGMVVAVHATIAPGEMKAAAARVAPTGAGFLDAPFTGSRDAAAAGKLFYYLGGDEDVIAAAAPAFATTSRGTSVFGAVGAASVVKVATNMITASIVQALSEALAVTRAAGLEPDALRAAVEGNACRSGITDLKLSNMIAGDFTPHFSLKNMLKDARLALDIARGAGITLPSLERTAGAMEELASDPDVAEMDFSVLARRFSGNSAPKQATIPCNGNTGS